MTVRLTEVIDYLDSTLEIGRFKDYGPNGLQVEGSQEVDRVVTGVSANAALFASAVERQADLVIVHHGLIWGGGIRAVTGPVARRLGMLLRNSMSLAAYHLPLDHHLRLGNNTGLADAIALGPDRGSFGEVRGIELGLSGSFAAPLERSDAISRIGGGVCGGQTPQFVFPYGPETVRKVGLCTGAAGDLLEDAARDGCDLFLTGELAERAGELARELQVTLVAAGHYATEIFGPMRLAQELSMVFPSLSTEFVSIPSPL